MAAHQRCPLPSELDSDQQAAVLFSPFREKSLNPQSWSRKMAFWQQLLSQTALERRTITVDVAALSLMFERNGITPKCLGTVIEEMKKSGQIESIDEQRRRQSWLSWGFSTLVKQPLTWGVAQLFGAANIDKTVYIWPQVVKKLSEEVINLYQASLQDELSDGLLSLAQLRHLCQASIPSDADFQIVLTQLQRDHKITALQLEDKEIVIQFCKRGEVSASPIREIDVQIYRIRMTEKKLEKDIEALSLTADRLLTDARSHLREGRKTMAKQCLRKKRVVVTTMDNRYACLSKLQDILQNIEDASTHEKVVQACAAGASVLTHLHQQLSVERVEAVMEEVRQAIESEEELGAAMSSSLDVDDQDELEQDLQQLLATSVGADKTTTSQASPGLEDASWDSGLAAAIEAGTQAEKQDIHTRPEHLLHPLNNLTLDDIGLPDVPKHSPHSSLQSTAQTEGTSRQQTAGTSRQQTAGTSRQQTAGTSRQQTADSRQREPADSRQREPADSRQREPADSRQRETADSGNQQTADSGNQQTADSGSQQTADSGNQQTADSGNQQTAVVLLT